MDGTHSKLQFVGTVELQFSCNVKIAYTVTISEKETVILIFQIL